MYYPRQVAWIKTSFKKKKLLPDDILSEAEVLRMIRTASNPRDKAVIALLYDSGIRVGELVNMRIKDINLKEEPAHITVDGKTGQRRVPILFSAPYMAVYFESQTEKKAVDPLWSAGGSWSNMNWSIDEAGIRKILREVAKKAGIEKRIYPYLFRHSRATYYANQLTEQTLKAIFGWSGSSTMVSIYVHMSGRDVDNAVLQVYGKQPKEVIAPKLTEKVCPRCRFGNGIDFVHCKKCGAPLDIGTLMKSEEVTERLKAAMLDSLGDPEFQKMVQKYAMEKEKGKQGE